MATIETTRSLERPTETAEAKRYDVGGIMLPRPFQVRKFGHIGFYNRANDATAQFYLDHLGFRLSDSVGMTEDSPPLAHFTTIGADHHSVVHVDAMFAKDDKNYPTGITFNQLSYQVGSLEEIAAAYDYVVDQGFEIHGIGRDFPGSNWAFYFFAPEGVLVELFYGMEQIGWQRTSKPRSLWLNEPIVMNPHNVPKMPIASEYQEVLEVEQRADISGGFRGPAQRPFDFSVGGVSLPRPFAINKIGPVHIFLDDVRRSEQFYVEHLGLHVTEVVEWEGHRCVYLRSGAEHHTLALFPIALRDRFGFPGHTKLMAVGVEVGTYRQLRDSRDYFRSQGIAIIDDIPKALLPGIDFAFHVRDPEGHTLLYYCYMEQLGWQGTPRPASERRPVPTEWPDVLEPHSDSFMDQILQGPLA